MNPEEQSEKNKEKVKKDNTNKNVLKELEEKDISKLKEITNKLQMCSNCGLCKEICPVFNSLLIESYSARGKNNLIKEIKINPEILYKCTLCKACEEICPSNLKLTEIFREVRVLFVDNGAELDANKKFIENIKKYDVPFDIKTKEHKEFYCC